LEQKKFQLAVIFAQKGRQHNPHHGELCFLEAKALDELKVHTSMSIQSYILSTYLTDDPIIIEKALYRIVVLLSSTPYLNDTMIFAQEALKFNENDFTMLGILGKCFIEDSHLELASVFLKKRYLQHPNVEACLDYADCLARMKNSKKLLEVCQTGMRKFRNSAYYCILQQFRDMALELRSDPNNSPLWLGTYAISEQKVQKEREPLVK
jgi:hypothetical protein